MAGHVSFTKFKQGLVLLSEISRD